MKVKVGKTECTGRGIFALSDIKKDEHIFTFSGAIIKDKEYARKLGCTLQVGSDAWIEPQHNSIGRYINHSCSPNAGIKGRRQICAIKDIRKGAEITIDYSITDNDPLWKMKCKCRSKNCRKIIRSIQFLPIKTFNKYQPFIPKFLQKSYLEKNRKSSAQPLY
jgi:hypothetical protein